MGPKPCVCGHSPEEHDNGNVWNTKCNGDDVDSNDCPCIAYEADEEYE